MILIIFLVVFGIVVMQFPPGKRIFAARIMILLLLVNVWYTNSRHTRYISPDQIIDCCEKPYGRCECPVDYETQRYTLVYLIVQACLLIWSNFVNFGIVFINSSFLCVFRIIGTILLFFQIGSGCHDDDCGHVVLFFYTLMLDVFLQSVSLFKDR